MTWDSELKRKIVQTWKVGQRFHLDDVYEFEREFAQLYPRNLHVRDKLRQTLQHLRDNDEMIEFLDDDGNYRRLK